MFWMVCCDGKSLFTAEGRKKDEYQGKRNTADLVQSVALSRQVNSLSGDDIWNLIRLTWISKNREGTSPNHWKNLKIPALAALFDKSFLISNDLPATIKNIQLPHTVASFALKKTGFVNFRPTWRNSSRSWCGRHQSALRRILRSAIRLPSNDQARY